LKKKYRVLTVLATFLITVAQFVVASNACASMAHETEIPEALR